MKHWTICDLAVVNNLLLHHTHTHTTHIHTHITKQYKTTTIEVSDQHYAPDTMDLCRTSGIVR